jgi:hypothetical protein
MSDLQKMLYLLASTEAEPNLIEKMMYLLQESQDDGSIQKVTIPIATQVAVPVPVVDGVALPTQTNEPELELEPEPITYNTDCNDPTNQDIIADFITIDGKKGTKRCITGSDFTKNEDKVE